MHEQLSNQLDKTASSTEIREKALAYAKTFKSSWTQLGQFLYTVWDGKLYHQWGYNKFQDYVQKELGIRPSTALRLLKTYSFVEQQESDYLSSKYNEKTQAPNVPSIDELNVLRLANSKKELTRDDYVQLRKSVFDEGKNATLVRKDLTALMKERKQIDPEEERRLRNEASIRRMLNALRSFKKDMEALKVLPHDVVEETNVLLTKLQEQL